MTMTNKGYDKLKQIEVAVNSFNSGELYESSIAFYKALEYQSNKTYRLVSNDFEGFLNSFNLAKNSINKEKALVEHWKQIEFIFQVGDAEITRIQSLFDTQSVDTNEYQSFLFFTLQLKEDNYKRGELVKITRELNVPFKMPVIVLFHYGKKLTLSIIDRRLNKKDTSKDVLEKVTLIKDIDIANPQRAHKEILKDLSLNELYKKYEFHSFVSLHEAWKATLNISELNKKFYKDLAYWYFWALKEVRFPDDELKDEKSRNPVNVIRLITRLIFVWFLKEKNLVPDDLFNKRELDKILEYNDKTDSTFYKAILQNLFFATLNTEMNKDVKDQNKISRTFVNRNTGVPHYFRYGKLIKDQARFASLMDNIPFLNGGLFECLDKRFKDSSNDIFIDGFTQQQKNEYIVNVPDYLFFGEPRLVDLNSTFHTKGKKYEVQGLINILSRYKFTIEENTPVEEEVALDPELLGKVFENLLASYNEETETTARKLTGSFYTPREIVNYMVDESLISYLCNNLLKEDNEDKREELNARLHHLFSYTIEEPKFTESEKQELINAIDNCKILDPACGSGAFPMGVLHKLVYVLSKLDPNNRSWKQKQMDKAKHDKALAGNMEDEKIRETALAEIDKRIDDIEKAFNESNNELDFGRKLYLIENCIFGVDKQPIAIQISKLRFFIALIVDQKTTSYTENNRGIRPLPNLETKFVAADTLISIEKPQQLTLINQDEELQKAIKEKEAEIHTVRDKHFRARTPGTKEKYRLLDDQLRDELAKLLEKDGFPKDETRKLAHWNPYDQNKFAEFFDPMWMFEIEKGFDIVIGNPPYVVPKTLTQNEKKYFIRKYKSALYQINLYLIFIERGLELGNKSGIVSFIVPNTWLINKTVKNFRKYFIENFSIYKIADLTSQEVFEATVLPIVFVAGKELNKNKHIIVQSQNGENFENKLEIDLKQITEKNNFLINYQINENAYTLIDLIDENKSVVKDIAQVSFGVKFYQVNKGKPKQTRVIVENHSFTHSDKINKTCKKILEGKDVDRYYHSEGDSYIEYGEWLAEPRRPELFEGERILLRRIVGKDGLIAAFTNGNYCNNSLLHTIKLKTEKLNTKYVLAQLNSKLIGFYFKKKYAREEKTFPEIRIHELESLPIVDSSKEIQSIISTIVYFIICYKNTEDELMNNSSNIYICELIEQVINACVYELYFGEEMKKTGVDILALVEKDLKEVNNMPNEEAIAALYEKWHEPRNEVRSRLLLMSTRCPDTIGVIEASIK